MRNDESNARAGADEPRPQELAKRLPAPTTAYRRRAWLEFQRALDPLAPPKPLRLGRR